MVQESIVEYINAQMKLGFPATPSRRRSPARDGSPQTWKIRSKKWNWQRWSSPSRPCRRCHQRRPRQADGAAIAAKPPLPVGGMGAGSASPSPQTIRVSDLVSSSTSSSPVMKSSAIPTSKQSMTGPAPASAACLREQRRKIPFKRPRIRARNRMGRATRSSRILFLWLLSSPLADSQDFVYANNSLNTQLGTLNDRVGVNSSFPLCSTGGCFDTALTRRFLRSLLKRRSCRQNFPSLPCRPALRPGATSTVTVSGIVSAGKIGYVITAMYGAKIVVTNSKVASVIAALTPLMATAASTTPARRVQPPVALSRSFLLPRRPRRNSQGPTRGIDSITLTAVNGTSL